jgi:steroid delta-isomerase
MTRSDQMVGAVNAYFEAFDRGDPEAAAAIFADDAVIEDPVGSPPHVGREAIRAFYAASMQTRPKLERRGQLCVAASHVAFSMQVKLHWQGRDMVIDVIDTMAFDAAGKVCRMQAYFGPSNMAETGSGVPKDA